MPLPSSSCLTFCQVTRLSVLTGLFFPPAGSAGFSISVAEQLWGGIILLNARVCLGLSPAVFHVPRCSALSFSPITFPGVFAPSAPLIAMTLTPLHIASVRVTRAHLGNRLVAF